MNLIIPMVLAVSLLTGISYGMHAPVLTVFARHEIGATYLDLEEIGIIFFAPYMVFPIFVGLLLDRFRSGYFLVASVGIHSASVYLLSLAHTIPEIMALRLMTGVSTALFHPVCKFVIAQASPERARVRNIAWFFGFYVAGYTIGPFIGGLFLEGEGATDRMLFQATAYIVAAAMAAAVYLARSRVAPAPLHAYDARGEEGAAPAGAEEGAKEGAAPPARPRGRAEAGAPSRPPGGAGSHGGGRPGRSSLFPIREMGRFPTIMAIIMYSAAVEGVLFSIYPAFLDDSGIAEARIEFLFFAWGAARIAVMVVVDRLVRWAGLSLVASTAAMAAGMLASFTAHSFEAFSVGMVLMGAGLGMSIPLTLEVMISRAGRRRVGNMIGAYEITFGIGWIVGLVVVGELSELVDTALPYLAMFAGGAAIAALSAARRRHISPARAGPA